MSMYFMFDSGKTSSISSSGNKDTFSPQVRGVTRIKWGITWHIIGTQ